MKRILGLALFYLCLTLSFSLTIPRSAYAGKTTSACARYLLPPLIVLKQKLTGFLFRSEARRNVKVALCQIDTTVGDFDYNVRHILRFIEKAGEAGVDIAVFPELAISSYPPRDLLDRPDFITNNEKALKAIQEEIKAIPNAPKTIIIGSAVRSQEPTGRALQNAALVIHEGNIVHTQAKRLLPNYDVFDEARYFEPAREGQQWDSPWGKIGCSVCEDAWYADSTNGKNLYSSDPAQEIRGANLAININASPYQIGKHEHRKSVISDFVKRVDSPLVYVNQVGAQDDILFDGRSLVYSEKGDVVFEMPSFKEAIGIVDFELGSSRPVKSSRIWEWNGRDRRWSDGGIANDTQTPDPEIENLENAIVAGIRGYFSKVGYEKAVIGLSGGIDSSVVGSLAVEALGAENVIGVSMPSKYSSDGSKTDAEVLAKKLGIKYIASPIKDSVSTMMDGLENGFQELVTTHALRTTEVDTTEDNIQARLRAVILTAIANKFDGLVLTTSNKSELSVGQTTIYGDMAGALAPIGDLFKTRVYQLAHHLNQKKQRIPEAVLTKPASAELAPGQTDEAKFGPWSTLDPVLEMYIEKQMSESEIIERGFDADYVRKIIGIVKSNEFKRNQAAIVLKVTPKAYGSGRRIPVSNYYRPVRSKKNQ